MRLDWAMLADAASSRENLAFIIGGGIDTFQGVPIPPGAPRLEPGQIALPVSAAIVFRLLFTRGELGRMHTLEVKASDADGTEAVKLSAGLFAPPNPGLPQGWDQPVVLSMNLQLTPLKWGAYSVDVFGNGAHFKSIPFQIVEAPMPPSPPTHPPGSPRL